MEESGEVEVCTSLNIVESQKLLKKAALSVSYFQEGTSGLFLATYGHSSGFSQNTEWKRVTKGCYADILNATKHLVYLGVCKVNGPWSNFEWYLFLLLSVGSWGNTSCAISVALASYCIEAKNLSVLIFLTYHWKDRDRKRTQQIQCVDSLLACIKGSKENVISGILLYSNFHSIWLWPAIFRANTFLQRSLRSRDFFYQHESNLLQCWFIPRSRWDNLRPAWSFTI